MAGLAAAVGSRDELEVIVDRRRGDSPPDQPSIERRHRSTVVRALERDGFAIILKPPTEAAERRGLSLPHAPEASPIELAAEATYEQKLERILWSKHRRIIRLSRWLILAWLMNAILAMFLLLPVVKTVVGKARPASPRSSIVTPVPEVAGQPASPNPAIRPPSPPAAVQKSPSGPRTD
jgi:hypothetical protein